MSRSGQVSGAVGESRSTADSAPTGTTEILDGGLFRFALETFAGQPEIWVWAFNWSLAEKELETLVTPWFDALGQRLESLARSA